MAGSRIWDFYAPVYDLFMRRNRSAAAVMYRRICTVIRDKDVLEIAAGTGELARRTAVYARHMVAVEGQEGKGHGTDLVQIQAAGFQTAAGHKAHRPAGGVVQHFLYIVFRPGGGHVVFEFPV